MAMTPALSEPLLFEGGQSSPAAPGAREDPWWIGAPSRQTTGDSIVSTASEEAGRGAKSAKHSWLPLGAPARQTTGDSIASTVASHGDLYGSPLPGSLFGSPKLGPSRFGPSSPKPVRLGAPALTTLTERRGWKYFVKHVLRVPIAFVAGIVMGAGSLYLVTELEPLALTPPGLGPYPSEAPPIGVPEEYLAAPAFDNACLLKDLRIPDGPRTFDACGFVINSTDEVWNRRGSDIDAAIDKYFHEGYLNAGSWGRRGIGKEALRAAIFSEMRAFPDLRIHVTDCQCAGNDIDGFKCSMPDILEGTNTGPSAYGPATGRYARWTGMVQSFVKRNPDNGEWQYYAEWGVHDEWALIQQLGLDFARVPHPPTNSEALHDCVPLLRLAPGDPALDVADGAVDPVITRDAALGRL